MFRYSRRAGILPRITLSLAAAALLCGGWPAWGQWERVQVTDPPFSVEIPEGWRLREVEGRGARLIPPENSPVVEVVAWTALHTPATPDKAVVEHEGVLARAVDYRRDGIEQIQTDDGVPALVVTGRARSRGIAEHSIFCAYSRGATHYVLGTFASEEALPVLRAEALDRMMRSFRAEAGEAPAMEPPSLPEPPSPLPQPEPVEPRPGLEPEPPVASEAQPGPAPPTVEVGGGTEPMGPEVREPRAPWIEHLSPGGFSVSIPMDWEVGTTGGLITIAPAVKGAERGFALIWPVTGSDPGAEGALRLALTRVPDLRLTRVISIRHLDGETLVEGQLTGGMRLAATWTHDGSFGLLRAAAAPEATWQGNLHGLARMVASFRPGEWPVSCRPESDLTGEGGLMQWKLPAGWQARGGVRDDAGELSIEIEAQGASEEGLRIGWQQPVQPRFRALTPLLESLGWREGERYSVPEGEGGLLIYRRREPEQLVRDLLLPRHPLELRLTAIDAEPPDGAIAGLLSGTDAVGRAVSVRGGSAIGPRERLYLAAAARSEGALAPTCWEAAALWADAAEGRLPAAIEALAMMVRTARVTERATQSQAARLAPLIERARRAVETIPADLLPQPDRGLRSVLDAELPEASGAVWATPGGASEWWSEQAGEEEGVDLLGPPPGTRPGHQAP